MENLLFFAGLIIYLIINALSTAERIGGFSMKSSRISLKNYGLYDMQDDFSLERDIVEERATKYLAKLKRYAASHSPKSYLSNNFCEMRLENDDSHNTLFYYCKEKTNGREQGRYYIVSFNKEHVTTMWAIMNMEFTDSTTYDKTKNLYMSINKSLTYFVEGKKGQKRLLLPHQKNKYSQNEYCRMELINNDYIFLSEVWGNNPKKVFIKSNTTNIAELLEWLLKDENIMKKYDYILEELNQNPNYIISDNNDQNTNTIKPTNTMQIEQSKSTDIHSEAEENTDIKPSEPQIEIKDEPTENTMQPEQNIRRYNERNIDL